MPKEVESCKNLSCKYRDICERSRFVNSTTVDKCLLNPSVEPCPWFINRHSYNNSRINNSVKGTRT